MHEGLTLYFLLPYRWPNIFKAEMTPDCSLVDLAQCCRCILLQGCNNSSHWLQCNPFNAKDK